MTERQMTDMERAEKAITDREPTEFAVEFNEFAMEFFQAKPQADSFQPLYGALAEAGARMEAVEGLSNRFRIVTQNGANLSGDIGYPFIRSVNATLSPHGVFGRTFKIGSPG